MGATQKLSIYFRQSLSHVHITVQRNLRKVGPTAKETQKVRYYYQKEKRMWVQEDAAVSGVHHMRRGSCLFHSDLEISTLLTRL